MNHQRNKFKGGFLIGSSSTTWPNGVLEISQDSIILHDLFMKRDYEFDRVDVEKLVIVKNLPILCYILGHGIQIYHHKDECDERIIFWYFSFRFEKLLEALKEFGWL